MTVALVLAGGLKPELSPGELKAEALIQIGENYMVEYVVEALAALDEIKQIVISGPREIEKLYTTSTIKVVPRGTTLVKSFTKAYQKVPLDTRQILVVTGDLPLLSPQAVRHFLHTCHYLNGDLFYPLIKREDCEAKYPGMERTYIHFREGVFTGGNLLLIKSAVVEQCLPLVEDFIYLRKKPWAMVVRLNRKLLWALLLKRLSLQDVEKEAARLLGGVRGVAVCSPFPEIGFDVDKASDLALVKKLLSARKN